MHPLTKLLLEQHHHGVEVDYRPITTDHGYADLLCEMWTWPEDTIVVEHDIGITEHTIPRFEDCDQPWCGNAYQVGGLQLMALGCTKFTVHLKTMQPRLMEDAFGNSRDWRQLDGRVESAMYQLGHKQHRHYPDVNHFHTYP